jgi:stage II sporulation protein D
LALLLALSLFPGCGTASRRETMPARPAPEVARPNAPTPPGEPTGMGEPAIRVAVLTDAAEARVKAGEGETTVSKPGGQELVRFGGGGDWLVRCTDYGGLELEGAGGRWPLGDAVELRVSRGLLGVNGAELAPRLAVLREAGASVFTVVAHMPLEDYLAGVLAGEVPYTRWAPEALKAQAVVSRTFALYLVKLRGSRPWDVECTERDQVFKPGLRQDPILGAAVAATRGQVLTCGGRIFPAYFHSTCGGATVAAERVFSEQEPVKTLSGVTCPFCTASPRYRWSCQLPKAEIGKRLAASAPAGEVPWGAVEAVEFPGAPNRSDSVRIRHGGRLATMNANRFRLRIGSHELKSVWVEQTKDGGEVLGFSGRGFGHGVGLCQWGSQGMALEGYNYEQILGFYFPGGELTTQYGG